MLDRLYATLLMKLQYTNFHITNRYFKLVSRRVVQHYLTFVTLTVTVRDCEFSLICGRNGRDQLRSAYEINAILKIKLKKHTHLAQALQNVDVCCVFCNSYHLLCIWLVLYLCTWISLAFMIRWALQQENLILWSTFRDTCTNSLLEFSSQFLVSEPQFRK